MKAHELLSKPGAWIQGAFAKDDRGQDCSTLNPAACQFCLMGALKFCYPQDYSDKFGEVCLALEQNAVIWNDAPERTQQEVVALLKRLGI
jgi:hypothetical protein